MTKVGGEIDAFCTRCEMVLAHTIHAMLSGRPVKVECNTCHAVHRYRNPPGRPGPRATGARSAEGGPKRAAAEGFDQLLSARDVGAAQPYSPKKRFSLNDVVDHTVFGRGFVSAIKDGDKVEITFRGDVKVLVHGRA
jgi:hypothetical protein